MTTQTIEQTVEERFQNAIALVRMAGVRVRQNVRKCCRGCVEPKDVGFKTTEDFDTKPLAWTYGGQGGAYTWHEGMPYYRTNRSWGRDEGRVTDFCWNHSGPDLVAAKAVADAFASQGFEVEWNGTQHRCVVVNVVWPEDPS